jgi:glucose-6-phosphate isomerase
MPLEQSIDNAREERIGGHGIAAGALADALAHTRDALAWLRARHDDGSLPLLRLPAARDDIRTIVDTARRIAANATDVVILGTGGSSLGGQTLAQLAGHGAPGWIALRGEARLHFMDNLDPDSFAALLARLPLTTTRFIAISKSGGTAETLMQLSAALAALEQAGLKPRIPDMVLGLSEPDRDGARNGLRALLGARGAPVLDHDPKVGGRFSVLTNVGLLPAAIAGLDPAAVRAGAATALAPVLEGRPPAEVPSAIGAALSVALAATRDKPIAVVMAYADRLARFSDWYVQLWAESLGKDGQGTTPVAALGPVDQHSQLQLFIAGPRDKLFTIISVDSKGRGPRIAAGLAKLCGEPDFAGKTIGDLVAAQARATSETLAKNGCPVRTMHLERLDEESLGELLMHFMLETIIAAHLIGVDPFDQPAVEEGKILAKRYLAGDDAAPP